MKKFPAKRGFLFAVSLFFVFPLSVPAQTPLTLRDCFDLALKQSERVAIQKYQIRVAEVQYAHALGALLPKINFKAKEFLQDDSATGAGAGEIGRTLTTFSQPEIRFNARQVFFTGFRDFNALKALNARKRVDTATWENAKRLLFIDVAKAFYTQGQLQEDIALLKEMEGVLQKRVVELQERAALGKSRVSEQVQTETELASHRALLSQNEGALNSAKEVLAFFTGQPISALHDNINIPEGLAEKAFLPEPPKNRPDVVAAEEKIRASRSKLAVEKGAWLPTINGEANYYVHRIGFQEVIQWDATFNLDFPLFEGGQTRAKIQEAKILLKQAQLDHDEKRRQADLEVKRAWAEFVSAKKQADRFAQAESLAQKSYTLSARDYRLGLINNLEVLETLRNLEEARRNRIRSGLEAKLNYLNLKAAAGEPLP